MHEQLKQCGTYLNLLIVIKRLVNCTACVQISLVSLCEHLRQLLVWLTDIHKSIDKNTVLCRNALPVARNIHLRRAKGVYLAN